MTKNPPEGTPRITPMLAYADAPAAIEFLRDAFGFALRERYDMEDGRVGHAELVLEGGVVRLASLWPEMGFASPRELAGVHGQTHCFVDDVDAHYARARAAGATIAAEPPNECPTISSGARWCSRSHAAAATMSSTFDEKVVVAKSPSLSPSPVKSKRSKPNPRSVSVAARRVTASRSFPQVKQCANRA